MNFIKVFIIIMLLFSASGNAAGFVYPLGKVTIKVVDSEGLPVENAAVTVRFDYPKGLGMGWGTTSKFVDGRTDNQGIFSLTKSAPNLWIYMVKKEGYYLSGENYKFKEKNALMFWSPWNPVVQIMLKKKKNPTRMYAKSINNLNAIKVPIVDTPVGYDLGKGDWVTPYGKGVTSDFIFLFKVRYAKNDDWEVSYKLTFSSEQDGIQEYTVLKGNQSEYYWPYEAPENGYKNEINWSAFYHPGGWAGVNKSDYREDRKYIFRVRTKTDENGNIIEANYGKVIGDIRLHGDGYLVFTYFFNPSGTRSLEYDSQNPLFKWSKKEWQYEVKGP